MILTSCRVLDDLTYHRIADETLEELTEFFDELGDSGLCSEDYDCTLAVSERELPLVELSLVHNNDAGAYVAS